MNNSILWYQPAKLGEADIVTYNGKKLPEGIERDSKFLQLKKIADKVINKKQPWCGHVNKYFFLKGNLEGIDERGRQLSFMFATDEQDYKSALSRELEVIGYSMNEQTRQALTMPNKLSNITKVAIALAITAIIALIICMLSGPSDNTETEEENTRTEITK